MRDLLIPSNAPLWQVVLAYAVTIGILCYLGYQRWRGGKYVWTYGLRIEIYSANVPPEERTDRPMPGEESVVIGRVRRIEEPWFELHLEEPWRMWRATVDRVRIKSLSEWPSIQGMSAVQPQAVLVDVGRGGPIKCSAIVRVWP